MPKARTPRNAWIGAALEALAAGGPDAIRIEALAAELGVTKGGFYWHFNDRQALLDEMLDTWEKAMVDDVITQVEHHRTDARAKLQHLFELAPSADFAVELAIRDWSRRDSGVAKLLRRVDSRRMNWLRSLFGQFCTQDDDIEARSLLTYSLLIGSYFIVAHHTEKGRSTILQLAVQELLRGS